MQEELQALKRRVSRTAELQSQVKAEAAYRVGLERLTTDTSYIYLSIHPSIYLSIHPSIHLFMHSYCIQF